jgi:hypothetical protein
MTFPPLPKPPKMLDEATKAINSAVFTLCGQPDCCILASYALAEVLSADLDSKVVRVTAAFFPQNRMTGTVLGSDGCGQKRERAKVGHWHGHCAVLANGWLLDPTADQASKEGIVIGPLVFRLISLDPKVSTFFSAFNCDIRYNLYKHQKGFTHAPDARRSHWLDVAHLARTILDSNCLKR